VEPKTIIVIIPIVAILALIYAYMKAAWVGRQDPGNDRMQLIGKWIADGAMAFLGREYKVLAIFVICVAVILGVLNVYVSEDTDVFITLSFILGAFCSGLAGFFGMKTATKSNTRTTSLRGPD
jgi:K(+)-stimulated pyrophosphate-energized sodium pump